MSRRTSIGLVVCALMIMPAFLVDIPNTGVAAESSSITPEQYEMLIEDVNALRGAIDNLPDSVFKNNAEQRKKTLNNKLDSFINEILEGNYNSALDKLENDILAKMDGFIGGNPNNDWIIDEETQIQLNELIDNIENSDYDFDGLTIWNEVKIYGTDPFNSDTDGDGLLDGWEVENGSDPLSDDSIVDLDEDGLTNEVEIAIYHTNRLVA